MEKDLEKNLKDLIQRSKDLARQSEELAIQTETLMEQFRQRKKAEAERGRNKLGSA